MTSCASGVDDEGARFRFPFFFFFFCAQASRVSFAARLYSLSQNPCAVYGFSNDDASGGWYQKLRATCAPVSSPHGTIQPASRASRPHEYHIPSTLPC